MQLVPYFHIVDEQLLRRAEATYCLIKKTWNIFLHVGRH